MGENEHNQSPIYAGINLFESDRALKEAVAREGAEHRLGELTGLGASLGARETLEAGRLANRHPPELVTHDAKGERVDRVEFHPSYHGFMAQSFAAGLHCGSWVAGGAGAEPVVPGRNGANVARAAGAVLVCQVEAGHYCPITMTNAGIATLRQEPNLMGELAPQLMRRTYDRADKPVGAKASITLGMALTERQGGSDVRRNRARAVALGTGGGKRRYAISGEKWFVSAPMADAHVVLAQTETGLGTFLVPRRREDGRLNGFRFQRLKDKLGNRSNATAEVIYEEAEGYGVGEPGRGIATIMEMVTLTRLDCISGSTGLMRAALSRALLHAGHRAAFGRRLVEQPLMARVLADMALDVEAATALTFRLAHAFDRPDDPAEQAWRRLMTPVTKYWVCKVAPGLVAEAMECLGGNGYVEDDELARLYREAPVNSIWEGSGNIMCLDVLRVLQKEPEAAQIVIELLSEAARAEPLLAKGLERVEHYVHRPREIESAARAFVESLAVLAAGTILAAGAPGFVAEAFAASRLAAAFRRTYSSDLPAGAEKALIDRAMPNVDAAQR
ncbi:MAG: DNA alkylation response protein [Rhizobiales bacterium]|nr:DNA alkylation response protein [Hyphomicrobiales bacterium]